MNGLQNKTALVTGGSRGLGRGIVEALVAQGVNVWVLARNPEGLDALKKEVDGVETVADDMTDPEVAVQVLHDIRPDILILNAGATPALAPVYEQTWEQFNKVWETDMKGTFHFGREALLMPLAPGSQVVIVSSGGALTGAPLAGSYASAKRGQMFLTQYFQQSADNLKLDIRFRALIPKQIVEATEMGSAAATVYGALQGLTKAQFLERTGPPLTAEIVGQGVVSLLTDGAYGKGTAFTINSQELAALN